MQQQQQQYNQKINYSEAVSFQINSLKKTSSGNDLTNCLDLIYKLFKNIEKNPEEEKFLTVNKDNKVLKEKLFNIPTIGLIFEILGFEFNSQESKYFLKSQNVQNVISTIPTIETELKKLKEEQEQQVCIKKPANQVGKEAQITIKIKFNNSQHQPVSHLEFPADSIHPETYVHQYIDPTFNPHIKQLGWPGFGLWCGHDAVTKKTQFGDLLYQKKEDGTLNFDCEDHNCQYRAVLVPIVKEQVCMVCGGPNDQKRALLCMHYCYCTTCAASIQKCPKCNKRVKQV